MRRPKNTPKNILSKHRSGKLLSPKLMVAALTAATSLFLPVRAALAQMPLIFKSAVISPAVKDAPPAKSKMAPSDPDIRCFEESGFRYDFILDETWQIQAFDPSADLIYRHENLELRSIINAEPTGALAEEPQFEELHFVDPRFENDVATLKFPIGQAYGSGEMVDHDQALSCHRLHL